LHERRHRMTRTAMAIAAIIAMTQELARIHDGH